MATKHFCDICKKEFNESDEANAFGVTERPGYGSIFDGDYINVDLCCSCFDTLIARVLRPSCTAGKFIICEDADA